MERNAVSQSIPSPRALTRRTWLCFTLVGSAAALAACSAPAAAPTSAPAKPTAAPTTAPAKPTAAPAKSTEPAAATKPAAPTAAPKVATQRALEQNSFKIGTVAKLYENVYASYGVDKGIYKEFGLENPEFVEFARPGTEQIRSLMTGEMDMVEVGFATTVQPVEQGAEIKFVASPKDKNNYMFMAKKSVEKPQDLAGKTVGIGPTNAQLHTITLGLFDLLKVDPNQVNFVTIGSSTDVAKAVFAGTVDAGLVTSDLKFQAVNYPDIKVVSDLAESMPSWLRIMHVVTDKTIKEKPEFVTRLLAAYIKSQRAALDDRAGTVKLAMSMYGLDQKLAEESFDVYLKDKLINVNMTFTPAQVEYMQDLLIKLGIQKAKMADTKLVAWEPMKDALARVGPAQHKS